MKCGKGAGGAMLLLYVGTKGSSVYLEAAGKAKLLAGPEGFAGAAAAGCAEAYLKLGRL